MNKPGGSSHRSPFFPLRCLRVFFVLLFLAPVLLLPLFGAYPHQPLLKHYANKRDPGDWEVIVLGLNGLSVKKPFFGKSYFAQTEKMIRDNKGELPRVTDYARLALAYKSQGKDPKDIAGYNFLACIADFPDKGKQGLHAYIWSLIALHGEEDAALLCENVLAYAAPDGGFASALPSKDKTRRGDVDLTAMSITALAPYREDAAVQAAIERALAFLSAAQENDGGFSAHGDRNAESVSQVIIALCSAGVALDDPRFIKNASTLEALARFRNSEGFFKHVTADEAADPMASYQAALAYTALRKAEAKEWLYSCG